MLSIFGNITRLGVDHPLRLLALRQLSLARPKSWFCQLAHTADRYSIDIHQALLSPWSKELWKRHCKSSVRSYWDRKLLEEAFGMSTLKWIIWKPNLLGSPHGVWTSCATLPHLVPAARRRCMAMVGRMGTTYAKWKKPEPCPLCHGEAETQLHLIIRCPELQVHI